MTRIAHAAADGLLHRARHVSIFQHDEGVATAQVHGRLLQVLAGPCGHHATCRFAAGQGHAAHTFVVDQRGDLVFRHEQVGVAACGQASVVHQLLEGQCALRHIGRVLDHHHVAGHQIGRGEAGDLVVRIVPWLHTEQNAQRAALHHGLALVGLQRLGREERLGVVGVVVDDRGAERHLAGALADELAHL